MPIRAAADPVPRLLGADSAGQFVVSLDGRAVLGSGPYAGKPLSQVRLSMQCVHPVHMLMWQRIVRGRGTASPLLPVRTAISCTAPRATSRPLLLSDNCCLAPGLP